MLWTWRPPDHPRLKLLASDRGVARSWLFECPSCHRRCESLFIPPNVAHDGWRCRLCCGSGLIYASQRYGYRHPLRKVLTHRKRVTRLKEVRRQQRRDDRRRARQRRETLRPARELSRTTPRAAALADDRVLIIEVPRAAFGEPGGQSKVRERWMTKAECDREQAANAERERRRRELVALLEADAPANEAVLNELKRGKLSRGGCPRVRAARLLRRYTHGLVAQR